MSLYSCQYPYYSYVGGGGFAVLFPSVYVNMYINIICRLDWTGCRSDRGVGVHHNDWYVEESG